MPVIPKTLKIRNLRTTSAKFIIQHTIRKVIEYSWKNLPVKAIFSFTALEILLSEGRLVLSTIQLGTGSERVKVSVKNQNNIRSLLKLLGKWLTYKLRRVLNGFFYFWFCLTVLVPEKLKKLDFWEASNSTNFKHQ